MSTPAPISKTGERVVAAVLALLVFALYAATLLPGLGSRDTAEFQRVAPQLAVAHPTGYPLYTTLGGLWSQLPLGTPAWRMNLLSAAAAAAAAGLVYLLGRAIGQTAPVAAAAALALAASRTFWSQATIAEVYALAALLQAAFLLALLRWREGRWPLWAAGLVLGLALAHHRTIVLMLPGALAFLWLCLMPRSGHRWSQGLGLTADPHRRKPRLLRIRRGAPMERPTGIAAPSAPSAAREGLLFALALLPGLLLYLYLPLRAPAWIDSWEAFRAYVSGDAALSAQLSVAGAPGRLGELLAREVWPQLLGLGALLALLGAARLLLRDRPLAALLLGGYLAVLLFCALFAVDDIAVFLIPAHLVAALLLGEGAMMLLWTADDWRRISDRRDHRSSRILHHPSLILRHPSVVALALLALPALLLAQNLGPIHAANAPVQERYARELLAQPLPFAALLVSEWEQVEQLRYLQQIEAVRPDVEVRPRNPDLDRPYIDAALARGRAVYLLRPWPGLGLGQWPEGRLWRVSQEPPAIPIETPGGVAWEDGITLDGYTLPPGPFRPGDIVPLALAWRADAAPSDRYTLFAHLVDAEGRVWGQHDREPSGAPTDRWAPGQELRDLYGPSLDPSAPPGRYRLVIGWYSFPSLDRLPLAGGAGDSLVVGEITVVP